MTGDYKRFLTDVRVSAVSHTLAAALFIALKTDPVTERDPTMAFSRTHS